MKTIIYTTLLAFGLFSCNKENITPNNTTSNNTKHIVKYNISTPSENATIVNINGTSGVYYGTDNNFTDIEVKTGDNISITSKNYTQMWSTTTGAEYDIYHYTHMDVYVDGVLVFSEGSNTSLHWNKTF